MGDVGSLALGGALGTVAILIKQELLLPIVGGVFVLEALSVIIQVASFKLTGKRVFKMAPLHHHFELIGWSEPKVITRFLIVVDHLCVVQPDDAEAAVMAWHGDGFSVVGRRVVVVGAARSGIAAAELLVRRGARVVLTETRASRSTTRRGCATRASSWSSAATRAATLAAGRSGRGQSGRADSSSRCSTPRVRAASRSSASSSWRRGGCKGRSSRSPARRGSRRRRR